MRHPDKPEQWRKADDSHVRDIDEKQAKSEYAYLLFYQVSQPFSVSILFPYSNYFLAEGRASNSCRNKSGGSRKRYGRTQAGSWGWRCFDLVAFG